ncbi:MAG: hypothetical protein IKQ93_06680, partial [Candidatus Methanomethylophilaceae archaeon]|nr:hypothetical protein [Candidatus Methanomethylophilaceae archaeon]
MAVLAVLAMAFAVLAIVTPADQDSDAAAGDSSAPLGDGAVKYDDGAVSLGKVKFTPYVQESAGASFSNNKLTLTGFYVANHPTTEASGWKNIGFLEAGWADTPVISFALSETTYAGEEAYYYVFQQNSLLTGGYKVTTISVASGAFDKATGANPSFEFALDTNADVVVKIIKSATALTIAANETDFAKYTAGADVAVFTIDDNATTLKGSETTVITEASGKIIAAKKNLVIAKSVTVSVGTAGQTNTNDLIGIDMSENGQNIYIKSGATLTINLAGVMAKYTAAYGILHTNNNLLIQGEGLNSDLVINDTTIKASDWKANEQQAKRNETSSTAIGILEGNTGTAKTLNINKVDVAIDGREADCSFGLGPKGLITIENGARVDIKCSNRAIQNDNGVTVKGSSTVTLAGGEAGIKGGSKGTITIGTTSDATDKSTLTAGLFNPAGFNAGKNDRWGIRNGGNLTIYAGATVTADSLFSRQADVNVSGTLNITGSDLAGYYDIDSTTKEVKGTFVPSGLVVCGTYANDHITVLAGKAVIINDGGVVNVASGASVLGTIQDAISPTAKVVFGSVDTDTTGERTPTYYASSILVSGNATFKHGSVVIDGDFTTNADGSITINSGTAKISGELDVALKFADANATLEIIGGKTLTIGENGSITTKVGADNAKFIVNAGGTLAVAGTLSGTVDNEGEIDLLTGGDIKDVTITGEGEVVDKTDDDDMKELIIGGDSEGKDTVFSAKQKVIVSSELGYWNLNKGSDVTILGAL